MGLFIMIAAIISLLSIEVNLRKTVKQNQEIIELLKEGKKEEEQAE
jgi:heme exporter protein D